MLKYHFMNTQQASKIFEALSSPIRLNIFKLLVRYGESGLVAGEIASQLGVAPNNLSFHLKGLLFAGLVSVEQEGRFSRYQVNIPLMHGVINYLMAECCANDPERCQALRKASALPDFLLLPNESKKN